MNLTVLLFAGAAVVAGAMALTVAGYERRLVAYWAFVVGVLLLGVESALHGRAMMDESLPDGMVYWQNQAMLPLAFLPGVWLLFSLTYARGNSREFLARWRWALAAAFLIPLGVVIRFHGQLVTHAQYVVEPPRTSSYLEPSKGQWWFALGDPGKVLYLLLLVGSVVAMMNLERTFRASVGTMRWRIKFMILGVGILFAVRAYTGSQALLYNRVNFTTQAFNSCALLGACMLVLRSLLRSGHFQVSVYPSHAVLHNSLVVLLTGVYFVIVGICSLAVAGGGVFPFGLPLNSVSFPIGAFIGLLALVLFTIVMLSERVRLHTRRFVSRHFQRPLYDYRTVWRSFTQGMASRTDQPELCRASVKLVADTFQVLSVTIWLVDDKNEKLAFAASTSLSEAKGSALELDTADARDVLHALRQQPEPVDITSLNETWAAALRKCHPAEFRRGGGQICVPMIGGARMVGLMTLGDRVGGVAFSLQDFDLLKCVGDQVAAGLLNLQLSEKLLQAKEVEAFQTMSTFFVHDLKNTASTLNLMLRNLPVHFDDPAFREDALRGIGKTVDHINSMIERLGQLRQGLKIRPVEADLNEVADRATAVWKATSEARLVKDLHPLPRVLLDQEQMLTVITNLVINAREAVSRDGVVRLETSQSNGWVVLAVADNGCGMSADFLNRSLFRPFQTTKKRGLGIGMFQSKMIIEAHGGRIEVESEAGKGSTFRVLLPIQTQTK